jgi:hypothetical protein
MRPAVGFGGLRVHALHRAHQDGAEYGPAQVVAAKASQSAQLPRQVDDGPGLDAVGVEGLGQGDEVGAALVPVLGEVLRQLAQGAAKGLALRRVIG